MTHLLRRSTAISLGALALLAAGCPSSGGKCESSALCDEGTFCFEGQCVTSLPAGSCTPPTAGTLATGTISASPPVTCSPSIPSTWPPVVAPFNSGWQRDLGAHAVGETVAFDVPPGTASVTIHAQAISAAATFDYAGSLIPNSVVPTTVKTPNGATLFVDEVNLSPPPQPYLATAYYGGLTARTGSFTVPATSRLLDFALSAGSVPAGAWSFVVNDWNAECAGVAGCVPSTTPESYDISVVARPGPYRATGTLDVGIYLVGGSMTALAAKNDAGYQRFVWGLGQLLGRAGICLGTVTFFDVPNARAAFSTVDICGPPPCGELSQLFSLASPSVDGVHLFLVDVLDATSCGGGGGGIVGIDGSIPGPSGLPGAATSGAAMVMGDIGATPANCGGVFNLGCGSDFSAYIAAHEIGHWLGLYHTTEATGDQFDPLTDTGTCSCSTCGSHFCAASTRMYAANCSTPGSGCSGGDDLMFWVVDPSISVGQLTSEQGMVMRANPAVK